MVHLELDPDVCTGTEDSTKVRDQAVCFAEERVVSTDTKLGIDAVYGLLPRSTERLLRRSRGIVEESDVSRSHLASQGWREAVHSDVQRAVAVPGLLPDPRLDAVSVRVVQRFEQSHARGWVERPRELREELRMPQRSIQVDQQSGDRTCEQRSSKRSLEALREPQRPMVAAAMASKRRLRGPSSKQTPVLRRDLGATMLARQEDPIHHG